MRPKLYDDFTEVDRQTEGGCVYVHFRCPHVGCDAAIRLKESSVYRHKASRCAEHLLVCKSASGQDDVRVSRKRSRPAASSAVPGAGANASLRDELAAARANAERQILRNDELRGTVASLRQRMAEKDAVVEQRLSALEQEVAQTRPALAAIHKRIGMEGFPPAAPPARYVDIIDSLEKAAAVRATTHRVDPEVEHLREENRRLRRARESLRSEADTLRDQMAADHRQMVVVQRLYDPLKEVLTDRSKGQSFLRFLRKVALLTHPDKNREHQGEAQHMQIFVNILSCELRDTHGL